MALSLPSRASATRSSSPGGDDGSIFGAAAVTIVFLRIRRTSSSRDLTVDNTNAQNFLNRRKGLQGHFGQCAGAGSRLRRRPAALRRCADDNTADHSRMLVWNAVVVIYARPCQRDRVGVVGHEVVRIPCLGPFRYPARTTEIGGMVSRRRVSVAGVQVDPLHRLPWLNMQTDGIEPHTGPILI